MSNVRRFLSRRCLLGLLFVAALLFGLAMLHPYPRQSLFGPTIRGRPWCAWENEIRDAALAGQTKAWYHRILTDIGLLEPVRFGEKENSPDLLPIFLQLANDEDLNIRRFALSCLERRVLIPELWRWSKEDEAKILPIVRQHLEDDDPGCRLVCAEYLWRATKDREMIKVPLSYVDHPDPWILRGARITLCYLAEASADSFGPVSKLAEDATLKKDVRTTAMESMRHFGKRGLPILRKGLMDPDRDIRFAALFAASRMGDDAKELIPDLQSIQNDTDPDIRRWVASTLSQIAPDLFPGPANPKE